jgi:hypothetical protein
MSAFGSGADIDKGRTNIGERLLANLNGVPKTVRLSIVICCDYFTQSKYRREQKLAKCY